MHRQTEIAMHGHSSHTLAFGHIYKVQTRMRAGWS